MHGEIDLHAQILPSLFVQFHCAGILIDPSFENDQFRMTVQRVKICDRDAFFPGNSLVENPNIANILPTLPRAFHILETACPERVVAQYYS